MEVRHEYDKQDYLFQLCRAACRAERALSSFICAVPAREGWRAHAGPATVVVLGMPVHLIPAKK